MQHLRINFPITLPVLAGYLPMGAAFGVLFANLNYDWFYAPLMGLFVFAGSAQFLAIELIHQRVSYFEIFMAVLLINLRHIFYGISMLHSYGKWGVKKLYMIFSLTDETYSILTKGSDATKDETKINSLLAVSVLNHAYWVLGCFIGAYFGFKYNIKISGIEFILPALFTVLAIEQYLASKDRFPILVASIAAALTLILMGSNAFLLKSMFLTTIAFAISYRYSFHVKR